MTKIKRHVVIAALLLVGVGLLVGCGQDPMNFCIPAPPSEPLYCCSGDMVERFPYEYYHWICTGDMLAQMYGCSSVEVTAVCTQGQMPSTCPRSMNLLCASSEDVPEAAIWLADVCEPYGGFSADGEMTWDSNFPDPLQVGASFDGPWYEVEVNGPPWVVTEENMESFAAMVGLDDWHDLWIRSGTCYPQHVGNSIMERDGRMDALCGG